MHSLFIPVGRALARHLIHLRQSLEDLTRRLRGSVAATIGRIADEAAQEVVHAFLGSRTSEPSRTLDRSMFWGSRPEEIDRYDYDQYASQSWDDIEEDTLQEEFPEQTNPEQSGWRKAIVAACRAGTCWLRRFERFPLLFAVGVGFLRGIASWIGGPLAEAGSDLATSAITLADLASTLRSGSGMLRP